jgi:glycosyltransferase involved in cell wall biosynthesis
MQLLDSGAKTHQQPSQNVSIFDNLDATDLAATDRAINESIISNIAIVLSTYNGAPRLPHVLAALKGCWHYQQASSSNSLCRKMTWDVVVVDNNSSDATRQVVLDHQQDWPESLSLRYVFEPRQGAHFARQRGVSETTAELIAFLDDDNCPLPSWVWEIHQFAAMHPTAGAYGSQIHGDFEVPPPDNLKRLLPYLAIVERGSTASRYNSLKKVFPPSAGLVVRRQAWYDSNPQQCRLTGRTAKSFVTGEDTEMLAHMHRADWEIWYNPAMEMTHKIPAWRLQREYLFPFFRGIGLSRYIVRMASLAPAARPFAAVAYWLNDCRKLGLHWLKYRQTLRSDLAAACELELMRATLASPFQSLDRAGQAKKTSQVSPSSQTIQVVPSSPAA